MSDSNLEVYKSILESIDRFFEGLSSVGDVQRSLTIAGTLLENRHPNLRGDLIKADAELETIQFAMHATGQREAAVRHLSILHEKLLGILEVQTDDPE